MTKLNIPGTWQAHYVKPGTPYGDEPSEMVPVGWRVIACDGDKEVHAEIPVDLFDVDDNDVSEIAAKAFAEALNRIAGAGQ